MGEGIGALVSTHCWHQQDDAPSLTARRDTRATRASEAFVCKRTPDAARASGASYRSLIYRVKLLHDPEDVQLATLRDELQASGLGHRGSTNGAELVAEVETSSHRQANPAADTGIGTDILFAADLPGGRGTNDAGPKL